VQGYELKRLSVLAYMIKSLIKGKSASLQQIGTHMDEAIDLESRVKKAKRWLTNKYTDCEFQYIPFLKDFLSYFCQQSRIYVAIDGSTIGKNCMTLMISIIWNNRSIPICWVVRQAPKGHFPEQMHVDLFTEFAKIIKDCGLSQSEIVVLGDGEFDGDQLIKLCQSEGWSYVLKTAKDTLISETKGSEDTSKMGHIGPPLGRNQYFLMPEMYIKSAQSIQTNALVWHHPKYKRPLYLLSNLDDARDIAKSYKKRYIIETFFADMKSRGFNIMSTKVDNPNLLSHLLIVCGLAYIFCLLIGSKEVKQSEHFSKCFRKDRIKDLSVFQIGFRFWRYFLANNIPICQQFFKFEFYVR